MKQTDTKGGWWPRQRERGKPLGLKQLLAVGESKRDYLGHRLP